MVTRVGALFLGLLVAGCTSSEARVDCGPGTRVVVSSEEYCAYSEEIVIEGGVRCPVDLPFMFDYGSFVFCARSIMPPPPAVCRGLGPNCVPPRLEDAGTEPDAGSAQCLAVPTCDSDRDMVIAGPSDCLQDDAVCYERTRCGRTIWCTGPAI